MPNLVGQSFVEGTVTWFNRERGFGFVKLSSGDIDVFVHITVLREAGETELAEGDRLVLDTSPSNSPLIYAS